MLHQQSLILRTLLFGFQTLLNKLITLIRTIIKALLIQQLLLLISSTLTMIRHAIKEAIETITKGICIVRLLIFPFLQRKPAKKDILSNQYKFYFRFLPLPVCRLFEPSYGYRYINREVRE